MKFGFFSSAEPEPDWVSLMIHVFTRSDISHVGIYTYEDDPNKPIDLYHATGEGFHKKSAIEFLADGKKVFRGLMPVEVKDPAEALALLDKWCADKVEYSESQFIGFALPWLQFLFDDNDKELVCSEATCIFCILHVVGGSDLFEGLNSDYVSPKQFWKIISKLKQTAIAE